MVSKVWEGGGASLSLRTNPPINYQHYDVDPDQPTNQLQCNTMMKMGSVTTNQLHRLRPVIFLPSLSYLWPRCLHLNLICIFNTQSLRLPISYCVTWDHMDIILLTHSIPSISLISRSSYYQIIVIRSVSSVPSDLRTFTKTQMPAWYTQIVSLWLPYISLYSHRHIRTI